MKTPRILTGIKPTGIPHLGNYLGAIRPALDMIGNDNRDSFLFIADYHALTGLQNAKLMDEWTYQVAATWLALGLDPNKVTFYKQSDIPELFELQWILSCVTSKGLMNRAHAYKAAFSANEDRSADPDEGINMGLFTYPILMAADILAFETDLVPVGADQQQHVEIARDIGKAFNHHFKSDVFKLPKAIISDETKVIPGLDGRKMSKSYDNTIPIFSPPSALKKLVGRIKTDSSAPTEPKNPDDSFLFTLYSHFAKEDQVQNMKERFLKGVGWGDVKKDLYELLGDYFQEPRTRFEEYMNDRGEMDRILQAGAQKARAAAGGFLGKVRKVVGVKI